MSGYRIDLNNNIRPRPTVLDSEQFRINSIPPTIDLRPPASDVSTRGEGRRDRDAGMTVTDRRKRRIDELARSQMNNEPSPTQRSRDLRDRLG